MATASWTKRPCLPMDSNCPPRSCSIRTALSSRGLPTFSGFATPTATAKLTRPKCFTPAGAPTIPMPSSTTCVGALMAGFTARSATRVARMFVHPRPEKVLATSRPACIAFARTVPPWSRSRPMAAIRGAARSHRTANTSTPPPPAAHPSSTSPSRKSIWRAEASAAIQPG